MSTTQGKSKDSMIKSVFLIILTAFTISSVLAFVIIYFDRNNINQKQAEQISYGIALEKCIEDKDIEKKESCLDIELDSIKRVYAEEEGSTYSGWYTAFSVEIGDVQKLFVVRLGSWGGLVPDNI